MSAKEYWEGDSTLPIFYRQAFKQKEEAKFREMNFNAWLQGKYITQAIAAALAPKNCEYPAEPYGEAEMKEKERRARMTEEELIAEEREKIRASIMQFKKGR